MGLTHQTLELIDRYVFGVSMITKSSSVLDDLPLLKSINNHSKAVASMTVTTCDENLCKIIEPNVSSTYQRFQTSMTLKEEGIVTIVWLCPILPFINDTMDNLKGILDYCILAEVKGIVCFGMGVTLREGSREYFYQALDKHFVGMKEK